MCTYTLQVVIYKKHNGFMHIQWKNKTHNILLTQRNYTYMYMARIREKKAYMHI